MFKFVGHTRKGSGRRKSAAAGDGARVKEKIAGSQIRQGNNAGSKNRFDAIIIPGPPLVQWRAERYAPSFRGEGWGKRSLQSAPYHRFGVPTRPEPHCQLLGTALSFLGLFLQNSSTRRFQIQEAVDEIASLRGQPAGARKSTPSWLRRGGQLADLGRSIRVH